MRKFMLIALLCIVGCNTAVSYTERPILPVPSDQFVPIILDYGNSSDTRRKPKIAAPQPEPEVIITKPQPKPPKIVPQKTRQVDKASGILISGKASWYCSSGIPICHHSYGPGSIVAAACAPLRAVLPNWRGKTVTVRSSSGSVNVKLVDWCGSKTKVIDLYAAAFNRISNTSLGTVKVRIYY